MREASRNWGVVGGLILCLGLVTQGADDGKPSKKRAEAQAALKEFGGLVGSWKGIGQVKRNQSAGAWQETASWAWNLGDGTASLEIDIEKGKYFKKALLKAGEGPGAYTLETTLADGSKRSFSGKAVKDKPLILKAPGTGEGPRRVTLTIPNENRFLLLIESEPSANTFARLGEVGFTRQGVAFAAGESGPVCIVTEGRGTIPVTYKGKTYYVCCSGCRDLFNKDPESILAEAAARAKK